MKLTKKQKQLIIEGHAAACSEWKQKIKEGFPKLFKEEYKVGDYLVKEWRGGDFDFFRIDKISNGHIYSEVYYRNKEFLCGCDSGSCLDLWEKDERFKLRKATAKEIGEHLIKEAERRGFVKGVSIKCHADELNDPRHIGTACLYIKSNVARYYSENDVIQIDAAVVYCQGQWAEIIPTMTKEDAEKKLNCKIV